MITPIKEKLFVDGYQHPCYKVKDKTFYSKPLAVKYCKEIGWEWPEFKVWKQSQKFARPKKTFDESLRTQCEIVSDTCNKVRLFYSGGRDSGLVLDSLLKYKGKLDEIAVYRRYPGKIDSTTNEWDKFNLLPVLKKILRKYNRDIPIKFYDLMPNHWNHYSKNLDKLWHGHFSQLGIFRNNIHTVAEVFPEILENNFVNIHGSGRPDVTEDKKFYWVDLTCNLAQNDPNTIFFFIDQRNTDLAVNMAYVTSELQDKNQFTENKMKDYLNFPKNGTKLDTDWAANGFNFNNGKKKWILEKKDVLLIANALQTSIGEESYVNYVNFYEQFEKDYSNYFHSGSIYVDWIGSVSEEHTLVDI